MVGLSFLFGPSLVQRLSGQERYMFLKSVGVHPFIILNILIKEDRDEKPQLSAISVTVFSGFIRSSAALAIRFWFTYL